MSTDILGNHQQAGAVNSPLANPFTLHHTPEFPELLAALDCSLAITTYQAGKILFISSNGEKLNLLPRTFDTPMGLTIDGSRMAVATKSEVVVLAHNPEMGPTYPKQPGVYDTIYMPRAIYFTGAVAMHDIVFDSDGLIGVNTLFSCLCRIDADHSFTPFWIPPFITELSGEDRCHLNGLAVENGKPKYVTALGATDTAQGWREGKLSGGILMDVNSKEIILNELPMPHTPRIYNEKLYQLLSATGELVKVDCGAGKYDVIQKLPGFVRGMSLHGEHLFVGLSRMRKTHTFGDLELAQRKDLMCGIVVIHLPTGALVGSLRFLNSCEEIYDVQVLPGLKRPGILGLGTEIHKLGLSLPDRSFWAREKEN